MDSTQLLPYEILQHVSSYLLPRDQCRLAITSHHCYQYLYTDLLRWHARKSAIQVPKCEYFNIESNDYTLRLCNNVTIQDHKLKVIYNVSNLYYTMIMGNGIGMLDIRLFSIVRVFLLFYNILRRLRKYLHKCVNKMFHANVTLLCKVMETYKTRRALYKYLSGADIYHLELVIYI